MADPRVVAIPVEECGERLLDVATDERFVIDRRKSGPGGAWRLLRADVLSRLATACDLLPAGVRILHIEGYRRPAMQHRYFADYRDQLAAAHPDLDPAAVRRLASRFVSPPEIAPHCAGAAVDLTLCDVDGNELDMGTAVDATPEESGGACYTGAPGLSTEARTNRDVLGRVLTVAGLVNYPTEWWHWSYGDRYWAWQTRRSTAVYGLVDLQ